MRGDPLVSERERLPRSRLRPWQTRRKVGRLVAAAAVAGVVLAACSSGEEAAPAPSPSPSPSPTPELVPVRGEATVETVSVFAGPPVFSPGDPDGEEPATDDDAVAAIVGTVTDWLDAHLTDVQSGGPGLLPQVAADGLLGGATPAATDALTRDLAAPTAPVASASYHLVVAVAGPPQWLEARVEVVGRDGSLRHADFVFTPTDTGAELLAAGPGVEREDPG